VVLEAPADVDGHRSGEAASAVRRLPEEDPSACDPRGIAALGEQCADELVAASVEDDRCVRGHIWLDVAQVAVARDDDAARTRRRAARRGRQQAEHERSESG
jgi:hypothetical protein